MSGEGTTRQVRCTLLTGGTGSERATLLTNRLTRWPSGRLGHRLLDIENVWIKTSASWANRVYYLRA